MHHHLVRTLLLAAALIACVPAALAAQETQQAVPENPCADSLYQALRGKPLNELTEREYEYFMLREKACTDAARLSTLVNVPDQARRSEPPRLTSEAFQREHASRTGYDLFVRNTSAVPIVVNQVEVYECQNVRAQSCGRHYPKVRVMPGSEARVFTVRYTEAPGRRNHRWRYWTAAAED